MEKKVSIDVSFMDPKKDLAAVMVQDKSPRLSAHGPLQQRSSSLKTGKNLSPTSLPSNAPWTVTSKPSFKIPAAPPVSLASQGALAAGKSSRYCSKNAIMCKQRFSNSKKLFKTAQEYFISEEPKAGCPLEHLFGYNKHEIRMSDIVNPDKDSLLYACTLYACSPCQKDEDPPLKTIEPVKKDINPEEGKKCNQDNEPKNTKKSPKMKKRNTIKIDEIMKEPCGSTGWDLAQYEHCYK